MKKQQRTNKIRMNRDSKVVPQVQVTPTPPPSPQVAEKQKTVMTKYIQDKHPNQTITYVRKPETVIDTLTMIPVDKNDAPVKLRALVTKYFVNVPNCHHNIHTLPITQSELEKESIESVTEQEYGIAYPIVSKYNIIHCNICMNDDHPIMLKSKQHGIMYFYADPANMLEINRIQFPTDLQKSNPIQIINHDVWINLDSKELQNGRVDDIKDKIIRLTKRKSFEKVITLSGKYQNVTEEFYDFGRLIQWTEELDGTTTEFIIHEDIETDHENDDEDNQPKFVKMNQLGVPNSVEAAPVTINVPDNNNGMSNGPVESTNSDHEMTEDESDHSSEESDTSDNEETDYSGGLIYNMIEPKDFENNIKWFENNFGLTVHVATYANSRLSVNVVDSVDEGKREEIILKISEMGYDIADNYDTKICINGKILVRWSILFGSRTRVQEYDPFNDTLSTLVAKPSSNVLSTVAILENAFYRRESKQGNEDIILNFKNTSLCRGLLTRDINHIFEQGLCAHLTDILEDSRDRLDFIELFATLKYSSDIPKHLLIVNINDITIQAYSSDM